MEGVGRWGGGKVGIQIYNLIFCDTVFLNDT